MTRLRRRHGRTRRCVLAVAVVVPLAGCGGSGDEVEVRVTASPESSAIATDGTGTGTDTDTDAAADGADDERDATDGSSDGSPGPPGAAAAPVFGLPELVLVTLPSDDQRPLLEWEPVPGATVYSVSVYTPSGVGYWAWRTDSTSVHLGGDPRLRDDVSGPSTVPGMTWSVIAFDADRVPIAASARAVLRS